MTQCFRLPTELVLFLVGLAKRWVQLVKASPLMGSSLLKSGFPSGIAVCTPVMATAINSFPPAMAPASTEETASGDGHMGPDCACRMIAQPFRYFQLKILTSPLASAGVSVGLDFYESWTLRRLENGSSGKLGKSTGKEGL